MFARKNLLATDFYQSSPKGGPASPFKSLNSSRGILGYMASDSGPSEGVPGARSSGVGVLPASHGFASRINLGLVTEVRDTNSNRSNYFCGGRGGVLSSGFVGPTGMILMLDLNCLYSE